MRNRRPDNLYMKLIWLTTHRFLTVPFFVFLFFSAFLSCRESSEPFQPPTISLDETTGLYLPEDLQATLWAESPRLYNPTSMDIDIRGRIWVTEGVNYRNFTNDSTKFLHHSLGDRVVILEDRDGDGHADTAKVFVQDPDLTTPMGIAVIGNRVIVSCAPNLIVYTDEDGDDIPDKKQVLLTGFGGFDHDHSLHALYAGPDGNWYFNTGNAGPHTVTDRYGWTLRSGSLYTGGTPYNGENSGNRKSDDGRVWVGGLALRMTPSGTNLTVLGHNFRNAFDVIPDSYGNLWQNDNDDEVVSCRTTWLMEGGNAGYFSADGTRTWQADQRPGEERSMAHWHQYDPGVMPAGDITGAGSPTGITVNESDLLGKQYRGMVFSADAGRNVIFGYRPAVQGSGYDLGQRINFISSLAEDNPNYIWSDAEENKRREKWFRPSDVMIGADGAIYIADWYDPVVGGHQMNDTLGYGRIYRIAPKNKTLATPTIDINTAEGCVQALKSPAINVRNQGYRELEKRGAEAIPLVQSLLSDENPFIRARAIWLIGRLGEKGREELRKLLKHSDALVRATAYRACRQVMPDILPYAAELSEDRSAFVRREVAISIRDLPYDNTKPILLTLAERYDGTDRWYLETLGAAIEGNESDFYAELLNKLAPGKSPLEWNTKMAGLAWRLHPVEAVPALEQRAAAASLPAKERNRATTALAFVRDKSAVEAMTRLAAAADTVVSGDAAYWLSFRQTNDWQHLADWANQNQNDAYERALAQMKIKRAIILNAGQPAEERRKQTLAMAEDSVGAQLLIGLAAEQKLPKELIPYVQEKIFTNPDPTIRVQAGKFFKRPGGGQDDYVVAEVAALKGDAGRGKQLFVQACGACHRVGDAGKAVGPELTMINQKFAREELLDAIIHPSAAIAFGYTSWLVNTKDGGSVFGFLVAENDENIVINDIGGQRHVIAVNNISSRQRQDKSLMPAPRDLNLREQDLADIVSYLSALPVQ